MKDDQQEPSDRNVRRINLGKLMRPASIAFIGGAQVAGPIRACHRAGFAGEILVVNPKRAEIEGIACVPSIAALASAPDAAVLALSAARTVEALAELRAIGAAGAVAMAAGFAEQDQAGRSLQEALRRAAGNMAVLGPNCMGVLNQFDGAAVWGEDNHMARVTGPGCAIVSQSGAFLFGMTNVEQVFPLGYAVSIGNQAVVDMSDCITSLLDDVRVRAIGIYLEGLDDGAALGEACALARARGVPIVAIKGGDTVEGQRAAISHTAAMVVERDLWDAFRERYGIAEVTSPKALVETLKYLTVAGLPRGGRLTTVSFSGGLNGLIAAQAIQSGLALPQPLAKNAERLRAMMPPSVPISNPLDLNLPFRSSSGASMEDGGLVAEAIVALAEGVSDQVVFFVDVPRPDENRLNEAWLPSVEAMIEVARRLDLPCAVAGILPEGLDPALRQRLMDGGVAPLLGFGDTMTALRVAAELAQARARGGVPPKRLLDCAPLDSGRMLDEARSKSALGKAGLVTPEFRIATLGQVAEAATGLGFPVALKVLSTEIAHKARVGGVRLNLRTRQEVIEAAAGIQSDVAAAIPAAQVDRFLVERMVSGAEAEFIIGIKRHAALGLAMMIGIGGTAVETGAAFGTLLLPLVEQDLDAALARFGAAPGTARHQSLAKAARSVEAYALAHRSSLVTLDVNPLIVTAAGEAIAADALIVLADENEE